MAIYEFNDFEYRNVLRLAPDAFVLFNGALGAKIVSPVADGKTQNINSFGGIASLNVSNAVYPPGSGRATISVIAPEYKGLHTDYFVTLPSGVRIPYFLPLMEVKIYMKGRFPTPGTNEYSYYPVFWGFIVDVSEDYHDGMVTFNLTCSDMLAWWKYQKLTINPSVFTPIFGGPRMENFPTLFKNSNPWQIITLLMYETDWLSKTGDTFNFVYPRLSNVYLMPDLGGIPPSTIGGLANQVTNYWSKRFTFGDSEQLPLEMFGLNGPIETESVKELYQATKNGGDNFNKNFSETIGAKLNIDYNLLARVLPFGDIKLFGDGAEPVDMTKLEIATKVCDLTHMEFFMDNNGTLVFKPPFYNLDVARSRVDDYIIDPKDIINYNASTNSENIVTFLELTSVRDDTRRLGQDFCITGFHIDWDLMARYGLRYQRSHIEYGNDAKTLRLLCAAEMARINGKATVGSVSIPARPEIRLGYPVYITHKDVYYYVTGVTHSFTYGSSSTTDLVLEMRRDRIYDVDGSLTRSVKINYETNKVESDDKIETADATGEGRLLRGFVYRFVKNADQQQSLDFTEKNKENMLMDAYKSKFDFDKIDYLKSETDKEAFLRQTEIIAGTKLNGSYKISPAMLSAKSTDESANNQGLVNSLSPIVSNELIMITDDTVPYTDMNGYRHIGAFPYGANLKLRYSGDLVDMEDMAQLATYEAEKLAKDTENSQYEIYHDDLNPYTTMPIDKIGLVKSDDTKIEELVTDTKNESTHRYSLRITQ